MTARVRATRFSTFAPASIAHYLEHVWLGAPDAGDEPALAADGGEPPELIPAAALAGRRDALVAAMVALYGGDACAHARALLSQWSKYYFNLAASAGFAAALLLGRPLDMTPQRMRVVLRAGMPSALIFDADALRPAQAEPAPRYAALVDHLRATIDSLAALAKLSPRVLWANAGNLLDYLFEQCAHAPRAAADAAWLFGPVDARGEANPLRLPVRRVKPCSERLPDPFRARRVCCLRNEIPGEDQLCGSCPLLLTMCDDELAKQDAAH
ncbi:MULTISPECIES: siderophore-iron reductase FhuF [Burkholderia]|uniref:siderophore-iron reductase FhuF n=1 Tax=Burkholderia TaxID=32008 RepID=UPI00075AC410|nr:MULTISPECIES: siderophore-iron reductase FhuF [Burkholderia]AOJ68895.1 iron reductase [Burkholderia savannae]KVG37833.1 iron reductase [Burkholderia sp. MSMB0265]KVG78155.1 iron reductase [Burkholderia sp. MSMB2040]KVG97447.1 iron reductase [Burkholderia sp. MSMB2041]KVH01443.1 iron reductase [Burkholderia sp. MSMB2042]